MHIHGGKLYGMTNLGHILYAPLMCPKVLNLSVKNPNLKLRAYLANSPCFLSKYFHALPLAGCLITLASWTLFFVCHRVCSDISVEEKNFVNVGLSESIEGSCEEPFCSHQCVSTLVYHSRDSEYYWHSLLNTKCSHTCTHELSDIQDQDQKELS